MRKIVEANRLAASLCSPAVGCGLPGERSGRVVQCFDWPPTFRSDAERSQHIKLETYKTFPPMQDPASYNLDQVMEQLKKLPSHPSQ